MFRKPRTDNVYALRTLSNKLWKIYYLKLLPEKSFSENVSILYIGWNWVLNSLKRQRLNSSLISLFFTFIHLYNKTIPLIVDLKKCITCETSFE